MPKGNCLNGWSGCLSVHLASTVQVLTVMASEIYTACCRRSMQSSSWGRK